MNSQRVFYSPAYADDQPWMVWQKDVPVSALYRTEQTERRSTDEEKSVALFQSPSGFEPLKRPSIQRNQYHSVMNKMQQASGKAGNFSAWSVSST